MTDSVLYFSQCSEKADGIFEGTLPARHNRFQRMVKNLRYVYACKKIWNADLALTVLLLDVARHCRRRADADAGRRRRLAIQRGQDDEQAQRQDERRAAAGPAHAHGGPALELAG